MLAQVQMCSTSSAQDRVLKRQENSSHPILDEVDASTYQLTDWEHQETWQCTDMCAVWCNCFIWPQILIFISHKLIKEHFMPGSARWLCSDCVDNLILRKYIWQFSIRKIDASEHRRYKYYFTFSRWYVVAFNRNHSVGLYS